MKFQKNSQENFEASQKFDFAGPGRLDLKQGGKVAGGIGNGNQPGYDDSGLHGQAADDPNQERFGIDGKVILEIA